MNLDMFSKPIHYNNILLLTLSHDSDKSQKSSFKGKKIPFYYEYLTYQDQYMLTYSE